MPSKEATETGRMLEALPSRRACLESHSSHCCCLSGNIHHTPQAYDFVCDWAGASYHILIDPTDIPHALGERLRQLSGGTLASTSLRAYHVGSVTFNNVIDILTTRFAYAGSAMVDDKLLLLQIKYVHGSIISIRIT